MMKAVEIIDGELRLTERPTPVPDSHEVLIRVHAAGINRPDILQRLGKYPPPPGVTDIPGLEISGIRQDTGKAVCALLSGGGYAEYAVAPASQCLPVPDGFNMIQAAALPETVFTVWKNLFLHGALKPQETILIHGGASGIGTMAIQMAKAWDATVIVTAGSDEKCAACLQIGADLAINYKTQDFVEETLRFTNDGDSGVDIILDMVGGDYVPRNIELLRYGGRHISIAFLRGIAAEINIRSVMHKNLTLTGSTLRARPAEEKADIASGLFQHIWPFLEESTIEPVIFKTFPLDQAMRAHNALDKGDHIGKIVLTVD